MRSLVTRMILNQKISKFVSSKSNEKASDEQTKSILCMKCFSTKRDKECLNCMQDKEYNHLLKFY